MTLFLSEILDLIRKTDNVERKKQILRAHASPELTTLLRFAFHPAYRLYGYGDIPPNGGWDNAPLGNTPSHLFKVIRSLHVCKETYNIPAIRKEKLLVDFLESLAKEEYEVLASICKGTFDYGLTPKLLNEVFPGLLPKEVPLTIKTTKDAVKTAGDTIKTANETIKNNGIVTINDILESETVEEAVQKTKKPKGRPKGSKTKKKPGRPRKKKSTKKKVSSKKSVANAKEEVKHEQADASVSD